MRRVTFLTSAIYIALASYASAQVPVIDSANLAKSQEIATATDQILQTDKQIMEYTQKTLQAVTGDRASQAQGSLAQMALGSGFSMGQAPSLGSVISGGSLSFSGMGQGSQGIVSSLITGLQLVKSLSGLTGGQETAFDKSYANSVNVAATLTGLVDSTQSAVQSRGNAFTSGAQQIGSAPDLKASVDQNSQIQVQTGQTINEMIGVLNSNVAAANQSNLDRIAATSAASRALSFEK